MSRFARSTVSAAAVAASVSAGLLVPAEAEAGVFTGATLRAQLIIGSTINPLGGGGCSIRPRCSPPARPRRIRPAVRSASSSR